MTMNAKRRRAHEKLASQAGVRSVRRPVCPGTDDEFDLYYVRAGRKSAHPMVIIPGGPGAASVALYRGDRRRTATAGLDVIMVEHRGIGMSRHDDAGADLPPQALTIEQVVDDLVAVLDDAHVEQALFYGTSYGTYIAAGVGVRHPQRVHGMILDSPVLSGRGRDLTTPPAVAERIASLIPGALLVRLPTAGHSVLDSRKRAALQIAKAMAEGEIETLPARCGT
jgi:proline iminopeptidase